MILCERHPRAWMGSSWVSKKNGKKRIRRNKKPKPSEETKQDWEREREKLRRELDEELPPPMPLGEEDGND